MRTKSFAKQKGFVQDLSVQMLASKSVVRASEANPTPSASCGQRHGFDHLKVMLDYS